MGDHVRPHPAMKSRLLLSLVPFVAGCHARPESLVPSSVGATPRARSEHLRAEACSFVVLGEETSLVWPAMLQFLLDSHAKRPGLYRVLNGSTATTGVSAWTDATDDGPLDLLSSSFLAPLAAQRGAAPVPRTALCLVSLRGVGDEDGPVESENDMVGAERGADALERLALALHGLGIERIAFATPLFGADTGASVGLEHVALERLLARGHAFVEAGPDLYRATRRYFPDAYLSDGVHLNEFGLKLVAEEWYRWLAGPEAREAVVEALYAGHPDLDALAPMVRPISN